MCPIGELVFHHVTSPKIYWVYFILVLFIHTWVSSWFPWYVMVMLMNICLGTNPVGDFEQTILEMPFLGSNLHPGTNFPTV